MVPHGGTKGHHNNFCYSLCYSCSCPYHDLPPMSLVCVSLSLSIAVPSQAMYNAKLAPLLAAQSDMSDMLADEEGYGEPPDHELARGRGNEGEGKVSRLVGLCLSQMAGGNFRVM